MISSWASGNELWFHTEDNASYIAIFPNVTGGKIQIIKESGGKREVLRSI